VFAKTGIIEQAPEPTEPVTDGRRRQVQTLGGTRNMSLLIDDMKQDEEVEINTR